MDQSNPGVKSAIPFVRVDDAGARIVGTRCDHCGAVYLGPRRACGHCFKEDLSEAVLGTTGKLYNYTIVHRSFPGIKVPFVSATVDLDGGGTLRGNLVDIEPTPEAIAFDMPVEVVFRDCGQTDASGATFLAHYFIPAGAN